MHLSEHADRTEALHGIRADDIHKWIDGFFDRDGFEEFLRTGVKAEGYDPYEHRKHRHCAEALEDALNEFEGDYTPEQIKAVFETHIKDDYNGYIPHRIDFENGRFKEKYHESNPVENHDQIFSQSEHSEYFHPNKADSRKRNSWQENRSFNLHIVFPTLLALFLFAGSVFLIVVPALRENMISQKKLIIRELIAVATSSIQHYVESANTGKLSLEEAQQRAIEELRPMRYGKSNKDYFWIMDMHPRMIMHPYREDLRTIDLSQYSDTTDTNGRQLFLDFVHLAKTQNEGFIEYKWQWMDDATRTIPKISYVKKIPEWNWIIGTGIYIDDVETELSKITTQILFAFLWITVGVALILTYIIHQSRRIENQRRKAESGLHEAKERYRALVESSNEGNLLELEGEPVYTSPTLQRLLGYEDDELLSSETWKQILTATESNEVAHKTLKQLFAGKSTLTEFPAQLKHKNGSIVEVTLSTSRIFFSRKNGHVISIRPIVRKKSSTLIKLKNNNAQSQIVEKINSSEILGEIITALNELPAIAKDWNTNRATPTKLRELIAQAHDATARRIIELALDELGPAPSPFAFITLGSTARHEMTFYSDQDNALIFESSNGEKREEHRSFFLTLSNKICHNLNQTGFPYCDGGIMASTPKWCLTVEEWKTTFDQWIHESTPETLLDVNIFFDMRAIYGKEILASQLLTHVFESAANYPEFFLHYARNILRYQAPISFFGHIKTERQQGARTINLKECIIPLVLFGRLYSLKHGILSHSTLERIAELENKTILNHETGREIQQVFDFFWRLRFQTQINARDQLQEVNDELDIDTLTDFEKHTLRNALSALATYQGKISYDFFGTDIR